jgi:SOS-response transcriptional repressor LexA
VVDQNAVTSATSQTTSQTTGSFRRIRHTAHQLARAVDRQAELQPESSRARHIRVLRMQLEVFSIAAWRAASDASASDVLSHVSAGYLAM